MEILDSIAAWFAGFGVHPVLGGFLVGLVLGLVVRANRTQPTATAGMTAFEDQARGAGMIQKSTVALEHGVTSLAINGTPVPLAPKAVSEIVETIKSGRLVDAIKLARQETGLGLAEAKLLVDTLAKSPLVR